MRKEITIRSEIAIVPLTRGMVAIIDVSDVELICGQSWSADPRLDGDGYYAKARGGLRLHRVIMDAPKGVIVDHRDGDGLNCRRYNLRIGTQALNCVNRRRTPGLYLRGTFPRGDRWRSGIKIGGKRVTLGTFDTELEAHAAYLAKAREMYGDWLPAHLQS